MIPAWVTQPEMKCGGGELIAMCSVSDVKMTPKEKHERKQNQMSAWCSSAQSKAIGHSQTLQTLPTRTTHIAEGRKVTVICHQHHQLSISHSPIATAHETISI